MIIYFSTILDHYTPTELFNNIICQFVRIQDWLQICMPNSQKFKKTLQLLCNRYKV